MSKENDENLEEDKEKLVQTLYNPLAFFAFMNLFYDMCIIMICANIKNINQYYDMSD